MLGGQEVQIKDLACTPEKTRVTVKGIVTEVSLYPVKT